ncbi:antibiotic biosynthesis monooxygenase [Kribbella amoyensis]|nr:antibiotic biosynthesis monooxygenase [Kribbella amoyensis]
MTTVELTRFKVAPERVEELLRTRPGMVAGFEADRAGFLQATLVRLPGDEWLDIVHWRSAEDFAASRAKGPNRPDIKAFFDTIDALVSSEEGTLA